MPAIAPRLDGVPEEAARLSVPAALGRRFAIFADAEEEFDWRRGINRGATGTTAIAFLPEANRRLASLGARTVYLVDWPVIDQDRSAEAIVAMHGEGACEIGTQLHPWVNPPFDETVSVSNSFTGNLPVALQEAKLKRLTQRISERLGQRPIVYRAGRYGVGDETARLLERHGYRLDVSVRAGFCYADQEGPDFTFHPSWPWRAGAHLYEWPLTTAWLGWGRRWRTLVRSRGGARLARALRLFTRVPLTPEGVPGPLAIRAIDQLLDEGEQIINLSYHTPSIVPGHTPYVRDAADLAEFWRWWDGVLGHLARRGFTAIGADELVAAFDRQHGFVVSAPAGDGAMFNPVEAGMGASG